MNPKIWNFECPHCNNYGVNKFVTMYKYVEGDKYLENKCGLCNKLIDFDFLHKFLVKGTV